MHKCPDSKNSGTMEVDYAFETWKTGIHTKVQGENGENTEMKIYHDLEEKKSTIAINSDSEWQAFRTWMSNYSIVLEDNTASSSTTTVTPTGNTKTIQGYPCKEYQIKMESGEGTVWVTEDININLFALSKSINIIGKRNNNSDANLEFEEGFWLESNLILNDGTKVHSTITDIRTGTTINRAPFDLSGIPISYDMTERVGSEGN